jgi:hypothetical protein
LQRIPRLCGGELAEDVVRFCENENSGDLILLGWNWDGSSWSFAPERGAHAGPVRRNTRLLLVPPATTLPSGAVDFVRPSGLRDAAPLLGRKHLDLPAPEPSSACPVRLRIMSYNA